MANYYGTARTSYTKVKDEEAFKEWAKTVPNSEVITRDDPNDGTLYGFMLGNLGDGDGVPCARLNEETEDWDDMDFYAEFQEHLEPGWAVTVMEAGAQKHAYVHGHCVVITEDTFEAMTLGRFADETLNALGSPKHTECQG